MVDVDVEEAEGLAVAPGLVHRARQAVHQDHLVGEPGERVAQCSLGFLFQPGHGSQRRSHEVGHQLDDVGVDLSELVGEGRNDLEHAHALAGLDQRSHGDRTDAALFAGLRVDAPVGGGVSTHEGHPESGALTREAALERRARPDSRFERSARRVHHHGVDVDHLDQRSVGVDRGLGALHDKGHDAVTLGRPRVDQTLGLDQEVQSIDLRVARHDRHR